RLLLSDFLRHELGLTGTHVGCEHGVCGACTVLLDGEAVRACLMFAVQVDGHEVTTVEGLAPAGAGNALHPLQAAFREAHALQCGFCTPGLLMTLVPFLRDHASPNEREIREALPGSPRPRPSLVSCSTLAPRSRWPRIRSVMWASRSRWSWRRAATSLKTRWRTSRWTPSRSRRWWTSRPRSSPGLPSCTTTSPRTSRPTWCSGRETTSARAPRR